MMFDCVIVGAGPAGLTAAIYLARFGLSACVIADGNSRAARIPLCRNFPGHPEGVSGADLLMRMEAQLKTYGVPRIAGCVDSIAREAEGFRVRHETFSAMGRTVMLATGKIDEPPAAMPPAEHDLALQDGRLHYCPICDGNEVRGQDVMVLGAGKHGSREAAFLRSYTGKVALLCPEGPHASVRGDQHPDLQGIILVDGPLLGLSYRSKALELTTANAVLRPAHLYVALGCRQRSELAAALGAALSDDGCIVVDAHQRTSVAGVYAAGDVVVGLDQIATAVGFAAIAATAVRNDLLCA